MKKTGNINCDYCGKPWKTRNGEPMMPDCYCEEKNRKEKENRIAREIFKEERKEENLSYCRIDKFFLQNDFKVHTEKLKPYFNNLEWITVESKIKNLFIYGNPGVHKTGQVTAIGKKALENYSSVRYYRTSEIVYQKDTEVIRKINLLILDNFGYNPDFENSRGALFDLLDYRLYNFKATIIITNENVRTKFDAALIDRLNMFEKIQISGESTRKDMK